MRRESAAQCSARSVQLGLRAAVAAIEHGCNFDVIEALHVVKEKDVAIPRCQCCNGTVNGQAVDCAGLCQIAFAKTAPGVLFIDA